MTKPTKAIFAFRALDYKNRFQQPYATFIQALEALQSPDAYMGHTGKIVCYFTNGSEVIIPNHYFTHSVLKFNNEAQAADWLKTVNEQGKPSLYAFDSAEAKILILSEYLTLSEQLKYAMRIHEVTLVSAEENKHVAKRVEDFLASNSLTAPKSSSVDSVQSLTKSTSLPNTKEEILNLISRAWSASPELRLLQLLINIIQKVNVTQLYYLPDDQLETLLNDYLIKTQLTLTKEG